MEIIYIKIKKIFKSYDSKYEENNLNIYMNI